MLEIPIVKIVLMTKTELAKYKIAAEKARAEQRSLDNKILSRLLERVSEVPATAKNGNSVFKLMRVIAQQQREINELKKTRLGDEKIKRANII